VARTESNRPVNPPDLTDPLGRQGPAAGWFSVVSAALSLVSSSRDSQKREMREEVR
jgi:hypothetical protein